MNPGSFDFRKVFILSCFFYLGHFCFGQKGFTPYDGLKGKPHHVQLIDHDPIPENGTEEPQVSAWEIYEYDDMGRKVGYQLYRKDATRVTGGIRFFYRQDGLLDYQESYDLNGKVRSRSSHTYDQDGRLIKTQTVSNGKETALQEIAYDPQKPISTTKITYNGTTVIQNSVNQLDQEGRILLMTDFLDSGKLKGKLEYGYDREGNEVSQKWYNGNHELVTWYKKYYNKRNEEIRIEKYEIHAGDTVFTSFSTTEYMYDSKGNQAQVILKADGLVYIKKIVPYYSED